MNQTQTRSLRKKVLSLILAVVMVVSLLPISAFASGDSKASTADNTDYYKILHLDCGRKYFSKDWIIALLNEMKADGYNQLQLAFGNDGLRFLLNDMSFTANGTTYSHKTVVSKVEAGNKLQNNSGDARWLTQTEMDEIIAAAKEKGIEIVPLLNLPGHANTILDIADDTYNASGSNNTLNVASNEEARNFGMAIFKKYVDYFAGKGCKFFNFGADEYANDVYGPSDSRFSFSQLNSTQYSTFVSFINELAAYIKTKDVNGVKMTPRAFNDGLYYNNQNVTIETVVLLSQQKPDDTIEIDLDLDELDATSAELKATYQEIKDYVLKEFGLKVSSLYISQVKRKCGIEVGENYNLPKSENARVPQCPKEKEDAIKAALKYYAMI